MRTAAIVLICLASASCACCLLGRQHGAESNPLQAIELKKRMSFAKLLLTLDPEAGWFSPLRWYSSLHAPSSRSRAAMEAVIGTSDEMPSSASSRSTPQHDVLDMRYVLETLKSDIPHILRREPRWDVFAEDFQVIDQSGARLKGLTSNQALLSLLRRMYEQFVVRDDIIVEPFLRSLDDNPLLAVRWKVQLGGAELEESPVHIDAETVFHLDQRSQVDYMRIEKCKINGYGFRFWPEVELSDSLLTNLKKVKDWAHEINELKKIREPGTWTMPDDSLDDQALDVIQAPHQSALPQSVTALVDSQYFKSFVGLSCIAGLLLQCALLTGMNTPGMLTPSAEGFDTFWVYKDGLIYFNGEWF